MRILVDMDEVLSDFLGGACKVHFTTREELERHRVPGVWDAVFPLKKVLYPNGGDFGLDDFWKPIEEAGEKFWTELKPLPYGAALILLLDVKYPNWFVVTTPSYCPTSYSGKAKWLKSYFNDRKFNRFIPTFHKEELATPSTILIDDREANIDKFVAAGGRGIVFPHPGNSKYALASDPLEYVVEQLEILAKEIG